MSATFHEVLAVRQIDGEPHLRWFQSDSCDLFLWEDTAGAPCRFQLCYDRGDDEHALTWVRETNTLDHHSVDDGERSFRHGASPMLCAARQAPPQQLAERFQAVSEAVPPVVRELVLRVLAEAAACAARAPRG